MTRSPVERWPWVAAAFVAIVVVSAVMARGHDTGEVAGTAIAVTTTPESPKLAVAPRPTAAAPSALPPSVHEGYGDAVVAVDEPGGLRVVRFECPACTGHTVLTDGVEPPLVDEVGAYSGLRWQRGGSGTLAVRATGAWRLTVGGLDLAVVVNGAVSGSGDAVLLLLAKSTAAAIFSVGAGRFTVHAAALTTSAVDLLVDHVGAFAGTVPLAGPALVQVTSRGSWSITPS
jgi:hypothetical protein